MPLDPRLLQSFVVLAEELHFGRAAARLNVAQPALSQRVRRLELQVGSELYTRNSRVVELTDAGRAMLDPARAAILAAEQAEQAVRDVAHVSGYPLRVGIHFCLDDVVAEVAGYAESNPGVQLSVSRMYEPQGHEMLAASVLDVFVGTFAAAGSITAQARSVDVPLLAFVAPDHSLARLPAVPLGAYRASPIAIFPRHHSPSAFDCFVDVLSEGEGRDALSLREFHPMGTGVLFTDCLNAIYSGHLVGFGPPAMRAMWAGHLRALPFDPSLSFATYVSWHARRSGLVDAFVEYMNSLSPVRLANAGDTTQANVGSPPGTDGLDSAAKGHDATR